MKSPFYSLYPIKVTTDISLTFKICEAIQSRETKGSDQPELNQSLV